MRVRSNIFPRRLSDWMSLIILVIGVPFVYFVEILVVLPFFHEPDTIMYTVHFFLALFIVSNISTNYLAVLMCDTSVPGELMPRQPEFNWKFCPVCQKYTPPRSWHCKICDVCILKRDHHCIFTGCCIGHKNLRYFMFFLLYICLSSLYALVYNGIFIYYNVRFKTYGAFITLLCPACAVFLKMGTFSDHSPIYAFSLTLIAFSISGLLLHHHLMLVLQGKVSYERDSNHNLGWRNNIESALGKKWYLTWMSPLIPSPLHHDGLEWTTTSEWTQANQEKTVKNS